jgi:hypothetical protein
LTEEEIARASEYTTTESPCGLLAGGIIIRSSLGDTVSEERREELLEQVKQRIARIEEAEKKKTVQ